MLRFTANLSLLFTEVPLKQRFHAAKSQGFNAVEIQFPYSLTAEWIREELKKNALKLVLFNVDADDLLTGGEGLAAVPEKQPQFKAAIDQALDYAKILQPNAINILPGCCFDPTKLPAYQQTFKENLHYAADAFSMLGVKVVFEAINTRDMPHFIVHSGAQMLALLAEINHPNLSLQYDIYHMHQMHENTTDFIDQYINKIGHIQFADAPGRHQPNTGSIDYSMLFERIKNSSYTGWVGAEYIPLGETKHSLDWFNILISKD